MEPWYQFDKKPIGQRVVKVPSLVGNQTPIVQSIAHTEIMQTSPTDRPPHLPLAVVTFHFHHAYLYLQLPKQTVLTNLGNDHVLGARGSVGG
jgi:hypothetical protein